MTYLKSIRLACVLLALLATCVTRPIGAAATQVLLCTKHWIIVPSPNPFHDGDGLYGVTAVSANDVWAVGSGAFNNRYQQALIEQWNGTNWRAIPSPYIDSSGLSGIAAISANNIWTVGSAHYLTLVEHWDGMQWSIIPSPSVNLFSSLNAIAIVSSSDIWAVGDDQVSNGQSYTLIEHWNGAQWNIIPSPNAGIEGDVLFGVTALSSTDVWASGLYYKGRYGILPMLEHWNGSKWRVVYPPGENGSYLDGITSKDSNHVWAAGSSNDTMLVERWNGSHWHIMHGSSFAGVLTSIAAGAADNIWAVGQNPSFTATVSEHWDGKSWQVVPSQNGNGTYNNLDGVAIASPHSAWAVGYSSDIIDYPGTTLIEHMC